MVETYDNLSTEAKSEMRELLKKGVYNYNEKEYPNVKTVLTELKLDEETMRLFLYGFETISKIFKDTNLIDSEIENQMNMKEYLELTLKDSDGISKDCYETIISEYKTKIFSMKEFEVKYPEYATQLRERYNILKAKISTNALQKYINSEKVRKLFRACISPSIDEETFNNKMNKMMFHYVNTIVSSEKISDEDKEAVITYFSKYFNPNVDLDIKKIGFSDTNLKFVENTINFLEENLKEIPNLVADNFSSSINDKYKSDVKEILKNENFEDLKKFDSFLDYMLRESFKKDGIDEDDPKTVSNLLKDIRDYSIEQLKQLDSMDAITIGFANICKLQRGYEGKQSDSSKEWFDIVNNIFENYLQKCNNPKDLLNDIPSRIIQLINSNFLPSEYKNKLIETYNINYKAKNEEKNNKRINEIKQKNPKIIEKVEKLEQLTDQEFEAFQELACIERANTGIFKEKYIDYIIKRNFEKDFLRYTTDENIAKRLIEDKSTYMLRDNGLQNYYVSMVKPQYFTGRWHNPGADCNNLQSRIRFNRERACYLSESLINMSHEIQHAIQYKEMDLLKTKDETNFLIYDMSKQELLKNKYGYNFYKQNYEYMKLEVDARIASNIKLIKYLQSLGVDDKKIIDTMQYGNINQELEKDRKIRRENLMTIDAENKMKASSDYLFQQMVLEDPKILEKIKPALLEFNKEDGKRKGNIHILQDYYNYCIEKNFDESQIVTDEFHGANEKITYYGSEEKSDEINRAELFAHIINNDAIIPNDQIISDMLLLPTLDSSSKKMSELRDMIIQKDILPRLDYWLKQGEILTGLDKQPIESGISALEDFALNQENINNSLSKSILKKIAEFRSKSFEIKGSLDSNEEIAELKKISENITSTEIIEGTDAIKAIASLERGDIQNGRNESEQKI